MTTLKPHVQLAVLDALKTDKTVSPMSDPKPKELRYPLDSTDRKSNHPSLLETLTPKSVLSKEQLASLTYAKKMRELYADVKINKRSAISPSITFRGDVSKFDTYKNAFEGHFLQQGVSYLFDKDFIDQYKIYGSNCYVLFQETGSET